MTPHPFRPGRLITGVTGLAVAVAYLGDAAGAWYTPWYAGLPLLFLGLFLAAVAGVAGYLVRRHRRRAPSSASAENDGAPASTSGSQATR
ncbi:hypothetical protein NX801_15850 [Streptomyces sp. LP05-1]|uniref:Secreted protein with PEP-CTERM sorting signal n=1 Tax=Streptomyces pyxinae TaxID=2970734 RepID=A0ABT2CI79_9ACTN|nr:hypothetical protein [Streptomyces sp. LP05-1]MCS0637107.1 hypothetical protein [Streptomyces sp. LP05-1]